MKFNIARLVFLWLLFGVSFFCFSQGGKTFYVSKEGSDKNSGTEEKPFASVGTATETIKAFKNENPDEAVTLLIRKGTYYLQGPLVFGAGESGQKGAPYLIRAQEGEQVVLSGGRYLDLKWKPYKDQLLVANVPEGLKFSTLLINGIQQIRARYPNYQKGVFPYGGFAEDALSKERIDKWRNPEGGYIHSLHQGKWGGMHYLITGKDPDGQLTYQGGWQNNRESEMHPTMRFVENIFEELDSSGEWYLDEKEALLYYYPTDGIEKEDIATVEVSILENLVTLKGEKDSPVHDIRFEGLTFTHTEPTFMKTQERLMRSDWAVYRGGAILMEGTENCGVENGVFIQLGGNGVFVSGYNRGTTIRGNLLEEISGSAISFVGASDAVRSPSFNYHEFVKEEQIDTIPGPKTENYPSNSIASGNLIRNIGLIEKQVAGIQIQMAMDLLISHNTIYNVPRAGINIGDGAWGGHIIEYNDVFNTVMETGDHGAFNSWGRDRFWHPNRETMDSLVRKHPEWILLDASKTTIIRNNRFHCEHGWDIDLDDGSSNYEIYNNLCLSGGIKLREGFYRKVSNNIVLNNGFHPHVWFENSHDVFTRNIIMAHHMQIGVNHCGDKVDGNFFTSERDLQISKGYGVELNGEFGDPGFINPEKGNFGLAENSPAKSAIGFEDFDMDKFGVASPRLKGMIEKPSVPTLFMERKEETAKIYDWHGFKVKNVETPGEQSAAGLNEITGVLISEVPELSPVPLQKGDVILSCWDNQVRDVLDLQKTEKGNAWKGRLDLKVWRNQQLIHITVDTNW